METGDGAAGDGDETEWKNLAGKDRTRAVGEARERRQLQFRPHEQDADASTSPRPLNERAQVVTRRHNSQTGSALARNHGNDENASARR